MHYGERLRNNGDFCVGINFFEFPPKTLTYKNIYVFKNFKIFMESNTIFFFSHINIQKFKLKYLLHDHVIYCIQL